ncbi:MAG: hypothetical protein AVDCRST_MAG13-1471, partial [uncultured Solirubrobacteraceae bacterium]
AQQAAQRAYRRGWLHAHRAPRRHPDHRHPRRDRPADLPRPAEEGPGLFRQVQRSQRGLPDGVLLHRQPDVRRLRCDAARRGPAEPPDRRHRRERDGLRRDLHLGVDQHLHHHEGCRRVHAHLHRLRWRLPRHHLV